MTSQPSLFGSARGGSATANVDGGSRGNPGPAGYGVRIDHDGTIIELKQSLSLATNNVAEYRAVLLGAELARELGADEIEMIGDSSLIAHQVRGEWKVKERHLRPLRDEAQKALERFGSWSIRNVPREENPEADRLVNEALDQ